MFKLLNVAVVFREYQSCMIGALKSVITGTSAAVSLQVAIHMYEGKKKPDELHQAFALREQVLLITVAVIKL